MSTITRITRILAALALSLAAFAAGATAPEGRFETPEQAVAAMAALIGNADTARVEAIFGKGSMEMFLSGDPADDHDDFQRVKAMIEEKVAFDDYDEHTKVALFGNGGWPWPIPLVKENGFWRFDTAAGREELLNRRIGSNELWTLAALREVVHAQNEFRAAAQDGAPPAYARRFRSSEGKRDGLWWPVAADEPPSPLGDLLADSDTRAGEPRPFHGYYFRILEAQGPGAPGGARDYLDADGRMTGGFAVVAWPAKYGNSGVMTFQVNQRGIVFQKDLGKDTERLAAAITRFDIDTSWDPTADTVQDKDVAGE